MDANDEKPEFLNMPAIADVMEVSKGECFFNNNVGLSQASSLEITSLDYNKPIKTSLSC